MCLQGYIGDPFVQCFLQPQVAVAEIRTPCVPSPCGANAICREQNGAGSCTCAPDYIGNPYEGCRPECVLSSDCATNRACIRNKCEDPCPGTCGPNAACQVINHVPTCTCVEGYTGNPFSVCTLHVESKHLNFLFSTEIHAVSVFSCHRKTTKSLLPITLWA